MIDAEDNAFIRSQPTGDVFRKGASARVTLGGVSETKDTFKLSVNGTESVENVGPDFVGSQLYLAGRVHGILDFDDHAIPFALGSKTAVYTTYVVRRNNDISDKLATKRAADYGQIMHCSKYAAIENRTFVFVTSDIIAAYCGMFQGVPVMQIRTRAYSDDEFEDAFCKLNFNLFKWGDRLAPHTPLFGTLLRGMTA